MTSKNNKAPLLYYIKLCASFQIHRWIQTGFTVRKRSIKVKICDFLSHMTLKFDGWSWKTIGHLFYTTLSWIMVNSYPRHLVPKTTRTQDNSYPRHLVPKTTRTQDNSHPRQLVPKTTRTQDNSYPGQLVPSQGDSYQRQLIPKTTRTQTQGNSCSKRLEPKTNRSQDKSLPKQLVFFRLVRKYLKKCSKVNIWVWLFLVLNALHLKFTD